MLRQVPRPGSQAIKSSAGLHLHTVSTPTLYFSREPHVLALSFPLSLTVMSSHWSVTSAALSCLSDGRQAPLLLEVQHLHCAGQSKGLKYPVSTSQIHLQTNSLFVCRRLCCKSTLRQHQLPQVLANVARRPGTPR